MMSCAEHYPSNWTLIQMFECNGLMSMCKCGTFSGAAMNMLSSKVVFTGHGNSTSNTTIDWAYSPAKNPTPKSQNTKKLNQCPFILKI